MSVKEQYWKYSLITIILGLGLILPKIRKQSQWQSQLQ